ncbi:MAG: putative glycoside hydrolase [Demequina sp.]
MSWHRGLALTVIAVLALAACSVAEVDPSPAPSIVRDPDSGAIPEPSFSVSGVMRGPDGPLDDASVTLGETSDLTGADGRFTIADAAPGLVTIRRPGFEPFEFEYLSGDLTLEVTLERRPVARALRVYSESARSDDAFQELLDLAANSTVNTLVFDTKDETARVLYETEVPQAHAWGEVARRYDPAQRIGQAKEAGLYTVTRIVTFEDGTWAEERDDHRLAGSWIDPLNEEAWEYPLGLAVEACELGFEEVQFDYVRFPTGSAARVARERRPLTEQQRVDAIAAFLTEARERLHAHGCAVSADIFGIVMSFENDQGIGQRVEEVTAPIDAVSPMLYPSHYGPGWLGFDDPNDHPGPVIANALDVGTPRVAPGVEMRPWIQAFYYDGDQVRAQIEEAEARGAGWILWNYTGNYSADMLPPR